ncbi:MAG: hypothetical protein Q8S05_09460 [Sulfuricella sp.]|nr:hypothetical protein [Sulfuricella sp.]
MIRSDSIQITPEILTLIAKIDEFKGAWRALGTLAPNRLSALRRVATSDLRLHSRRGRRSYMYEHSNGQSEMNLELRSGGPRLPPG